MKTESVSLLETRLGISECVANAQSELVLVRSLVPFEITEANAENITVRKSKGGLRPLTDAADAKDKGPAADYRAAAHSFAVNVANRHVRQSVMRCDHLRAELVTEIESAAGEFFAVRLARCPHLSSDLLARFALGILPPSTSRNLHRIARRACDARMSRMAGKTKLVEPSFFNLFGDESAERSTV